MAFTAQAVQAVAEGLVGHFTNNQLGEPQSLTYWLRGLKEVVGYNARMIEDDHTIDAFSDADQTEDTIQAADTWIYGMVAISTETSAMVVQLWDVATPTPGTTATGHHGSLRLAAAAATTPVAGGVLWYPYEFFDTTSLISSTAHSDYATGSGTNLTQAWTFRRTQ